MFSQLSFCEGSKGDPIFWETFGTGTGTGAPLPAGVTNYTYVTGVPYNDGEYTITSSTGQNNGNWHNIPRTTLSKGKALIVNASYDAGIFYERSISGLCEATTYEFSAFLLNAFNPSNNACLNIEKPINVKFQILDQTGSTILAEGNTGDIYGTSSPKWEQYALLFQSQAGQTNVILRMYNNGDGGCGNDLAIDDIIFRSCGDLTEVNDTMGSNYLEVCEPETPVTVDLIATPDYTVYNTHAFQWQESPDGVTWQDILGETDAEFSSEPIYNTRYFRVKVAENIVNLDDNLCSSVSEPFVVTVVESPGAPVSAGDINICEGDVVPPLEVNVEADESVRWFDTATGGVEIASGETFVPSAAGTYYAEAVKTGFNCEPGPRIAVKLNISARPQVTDESRQLCAGSQTELDAGTGNFSYNWSTGATGRQITINEAGNYSVTLTNQSGCSATRKFEIRAVDVAGIGNITSEGTTVIIEPLNNGDFEYSLDGTNFQSSNVFENISGGIYIAYVRDLEGCNTVSEEFPHIVIPQFITPNGDGINDHFQLKGVEYFSSSKIRIFDRYGKILAVGNGAEFMWDGTFNGKDLPAEDYWYQIFIEGFEPLKGHFTVKR